MYVINLRGWKVGQKDFKKQVMPQSLKILCLKSYKPHPFMSLSFLPFNGLILDGVYQVSYALTLQLISKSKFVIFFGFDMEVW